MKKNKEKKKKGRLKLFRVFIFLVILCIIALLTLNILNIKIKNIYIINNNNVSDIEIIRQAKLDNYPSLIMTSSKKITKNLLKNPLIKNVKVHKNIDFSITLDVKEKDTLYYDQLHTKIILEDGTKLDDDNIYSLPILINNVPTDTFDNLTKKFNLIDKSIREKISEIKYYPNDVDDERFILTMKDGNYVYITLTKIKNINKYNDILPSLEHKKGILYLDSGQYFETLEENE